MEINLYHFTGDNKLVNKTNNITLIKTVTGTLRKECDLENPVIDFNLDFTDDNVLNMNYAYIPDFQRYYYITKRVCISNDMFEFTLIEDYLFSFNSQIRSLENVLVARNENEYNLRIVDNMQSFEYQTSIQEYEVTNDAGVTDITEFNINTLDPTKSTTGPNIVLKYIYSEEGSEAAESKVIASPSIPLPEVKSWNCNFNYFSNVCLLTNYYLNLLATQVLNASFYQDFIVSCIVLPFVLPHETTATTVKMGTKEKNIDVTCYKYLDDTPLSKYFKIAQFTIPEGTGSGDDKRLFTDFEPYTQLELFLPYVSWITLPLSEVRGRTLAVYYIINWDDGTTSVSVVDISGGTLSTNRKIIYTGTTQLGVKVSINTTSAYENNTANFRNTSNLITGLTSSAVSIATGNITGGITSGVSTLSNAISGSMENVPTATSSITSANAGLYLPQKCRLRWTRKVYAFDGTSDAFRHLYGIPLNDFKNLTHLSGITYIGDCHLENFGTATESEKSQIENLMHNGIIL